MDMDRQSHMSVSDVSRVLSGSSFEDELSLCDAFSDDPRKGVQSAVAACRRRHEREARERDRVLSMYELQRSLGGEGVVVGVDEVGRGSIAGPLTVGAVALPADPIIWGLNDSKQLTPHRREELAGVIAEHAVAIGIAHIEPASIDAVGIGVALRMAMAQAIADCGIEPDAVLIDGNPVHVHPLEKTLVKGDARVACIAAASIVAKVTRDQMMVSYDAVYPGYHLAESKGYGSQEHIAAIRANGLTPLHRASFCQNFL